MPPLNHLLPTTTLLCVLLSSCVGPVIYRDVSPLGYSQSISVLTDLDQLTTFRAVRDRYINLEEPPTSTVVQVVRSVEALVA